MMIMPQDFPHITEEEIMMKQIAQSTTTTMAPAPATRDPAPPAPAAPTRDAAPAASEHTGKGFGGGEATRDPAPTYVDPSDPKGKQQAIHKAESFAEYLARRNGAAPVPAAAPAPP